MRLLHKTERSEVRCGDSRLILPDFIKESFDLVVTDPPYGISYSSNMRQGPAVSIDGDSADDRDMVKTVITECVRLVGQQRHLYIFGPADVLAGQKVSEVVELVWDKGSMGMGDLTATWSTTHEPISFATSKWRHGGEAGKAGLATRLRRGSVVRVMRKTGRHNRRHPTEKPVELLRQLIESSSLLNEVVLDPFAGVGSTGVAAVLAGRRCVLIEKDPDYAAIAVERVIEAERLADQIDAL